MSEQQHDDSAERDLNDVLSVIERYQKDGHVRYGRTLAERVDGILSQYQEAAVQSIDATKIFRDDLMVTLRAMALIADSVSSASTHSEKNARLRGMIELIEGSLKKLHEFNFDLASASWRYGWESVFQSDYPTRHYLEKIRHLEHELAQYRKPKDGEAGADDIPF